MRAASGLGSTTAASMAVSHWRQRRRFCRLCAADRDSEMTEQLLRRAHTTRTHAYFDKVSQPVFEKPLVEFARFVVSFDV
jgi:hypothetical protein